MSVGRCSDAIERSGYSLRDILASRQGDAGEALSSGGAATVTSVSRVEGVLSSAERRRLDRVYIEFMRRRMDQTRPPPEAPAR